MPEGISVAKKKCQKIEDVVSHCDMLPNHRPAQWRLVKVSRFWTIYF
jgi:hypothetical protein